MALQIFHFVKGRPVISESAKIGAAVAGADVIDSFAVRQYEPRRDTAVFKTEVAKRKTLRDQVVDAAALRVFLAGVLGVDDQEGLGGHDGVVPDPGIVLLIDRGSVYLGVAFVDAALQGILLLESVDVHAVDVQGMPAEFFQKIVAFRLHGIVNSAHHGVVVPGHAEVTQPVVQESGPDFHEVDVHIGVRNSAGQRLVGGGLDDELVPHLKRLHFVNESLALIV